MKSLLRLLPFALGALVPLAASVPHNTLAPAEKSAGWQLLFDGFSLDGWRASDRSGAFSVAEGELIVKGPRSHLYYIGAVQAHDFVNFEVTLDVKTWPKANSGLYFHTRWQEQGWPDYGYEVQVNNSHTDPKRTAGLYDVIENYEAVAKDGEWFTLNIRVSGRHIVTQVNGRVVIDYVEPADWNPPSNHLERKISHGTFAIQSHDPGSLIHYRNIKVRALP